MLNVQSGGARGLELKTADLEHCLTLDGCSVDSSSSVRSLGVLFDSNLFFDSHVSSICKTAFFHLHLHLVIWQTLLSKATYDWGIHKAIHLEEAIRQRKCS